MFNRAICSVYVFLWLYIVYRLGVFVKRLHQKSSLFSSYLPHVTTQSTESPFHIDFEMALFQDASFATHFSTISNLIIYNVVVYGLQWKR